MTNNYLPTEYQQFIHTSRYARFIDDEKRRESWPETVNRYVDFVSDNLDSNFKYKLNPKIKSELTNSILSLQVMPSMRALMTAGPALD